MRYKFIFLNHIISIKPREDTQFHMTQFPETTCEIPWELSFPISKRINVMTKHHGFIEYIFRDFDYALLTYRESAIILLEDIMKSLKKIRCNLALKGATDDDLKNFDEKIHTCFQKTLDTIQNRIKDIKNVNVESDKELLQTLETFKIYEYHKL